MICTVVYSIRTDTECHVGGHFARFSKKNELRKWNTNLASLLLQMQTVARLFVVHKESDAAFHTQEHDHHLCITMNLGHRHELRRTVSLRSRRKESRPAALATSSQLIEDRNDLALTVNMGKKEKFDLDAQLSREFISWVLLETLSQLADVRRLSKVTDHFETVRTDVDLCCRPWNIWERRV